MRWLYCGLLSSAILGLLVLLLGCAKEPPPPPPVPPAPEDLSHWSLPELVQPPPPEVPEPPVAKDKPTSAEQILDFTPGTTYTLTVPTNAPLDVVLGPGEVLRNLIGGDRTPVENAQQVKWEVKEGAHGQGETLRQHIFFAATVPGMQTGFIMTSNVRTYYLTCKSVAKSPVRAVRWRYPVEVVAVKPKEPGLLPDPAEQKRWHVGYEMHSTQKQPPDWLPRYVLDDGKKLFVLFPEITLFETAPMVRMVGPNGPALVNSRQFLNVLIVDQLAPRLELRVGLGETAEVVTIARGTLRTIQCPESSECPVFPAAAQQLAQRVHPVVASPPPPPPEEIQRHTPAEPRQAEQAEGEKP